MEGRPALHFVIDLLLERYVKGRAATVFATPSATYRRALEDGLNEVDDIRSQLEKLQLLVAQEMHSTEMEKLVRENEALRRELLAKDELISTLRQQIATQHC
ncbi:unnamed protein product [Nippostrongylus brasiliensis]|uniref:NPH3 domain-containing protein n=1 Tax=Nippostrongylus brasiliensis TaxID=27835 RepID=A0A0N4Y2V7_NIPBR|nr:unnamed protein product [Nippostrongylus brasiliensis]